MWLGGPNNFPDKKISSDLFEKFCCGGNVFLVEISFSLDRTEQERSGEGTRTGDVFSTKSSTASC